MADARIEIDEAREEPWIPTSIPEPSRSALLKRATPWLLLAITASLAAWSILRPTPELRGEVTRFNLGFTREEVFAPTADSPSLAFSPDGWFRNYDISADGTRFVMVEAPETPPAQIDVVLNWMEEVERPHLSESIAPSGWGLLTSLPRVSSRCPRAPVSPDSTKMPNARNSFRPLRHADVTQLPTSRRVKVKTRLRFLSQ